MKQMYKTAEKVCKMIQCAKDKIKRQGSDVYLKEIEQQQKKKSDVQLKKENGNVYVIHQHKKTSSSLETNE